MEKINILELAREEIKLTQKRIEGNIRYMFDAEGCLKDNSEFLMREIGTAISDDYKLRPMDSYNNSKFEMELNRNLPNIVRNVKEIEGLQRLIKSLTSEEELNMTVLEASEERE